MDSTNDHPAAILEGEEPQFSQAGGLASSALPQAYRLHSTTIDKLAKLRMMPLQGTLGSSKQMFAQIFQDRESRANRIP